MTSDRILAEITKARMTPFWAFCAVLLAALSLPQTALAQDAESMAIEDIDFGDNTSQWANDDECDDPRFINASPQKRGMAEILIDEDEKHDAVDCKAAFEAGKILWKSNEEITFDGVNFGTNSSQWSNDDECDDPRFRDIEGTESGMAETLLDVDRLQDANDCLKLFQAESIRLLSEEEQVALSANDQGINFGDNASQWAHDGECDDPRFVGGGMAETLLEEDTLHDASDCRTAFSQNRIRLGENNQSSDPEPVDGRDPASIVWGDNRSEWANDGECDDMRFEGEGMTETTLLTSDVKHDAHDCRLAYITGKIDLIR